MPLMATPGDRGVASMGPCVPGLLHGKTRETGDSNVVLLHRFSSRSSSLPARDNQNDPIVSVPKSSEKVQLKAMAALPSSTYSSGDKTGDNLLMKVNRGAAAAAAARRWIASIYGTKIASLRKN